MPKAARIVPEPEAYAESLRYTRRSCETCLWMKRNPTHGAWLERVLALRKKGAQVTLKRLVTDLEGYFGYRVSEGALRNHIQRLAD